MLLGQTDALRPDVADFVTNDGQTHKLLRLAGVVPIVFNRNAYNIPVTIWIPEVYPRAPPTCFVTPTKDMRIKPQHRHVDAQGMIYLPYLSSWNASSSSLIHLVTVLASVFGEEPPVFAAPPPSHPQAASLPVRVAQPPAPAVPSGLRPNQPVVEEKKRVPDDPRARRKEELLNQVNEKLRTLMTSTQKEAAEQTQALQQQQEELKKRRQELLDKEKEIKTAEANLTRSVAEVQEKTVAAQQWLDLNDKKEEVPVDELVAPKDTWSKQLLDSTARDMATDDCIYLLDMALSDSRISAEHYLKHLRKLARDQFFHRALSLKIHDALAQSDNSVVHTVRR